MDLLRVHKIWRITNSKKLSDINFLDVFFISSLPYNKRQSIMNVINMSNNKMLFLRVADISSSKRCNTIQFNFSNTLFSCKAQFTTNPKSFFMKTTIMQYRVFLWFTYSNRMFQESCHKMFAIKKQTNANIDFNSYEM